MLARVVFRWISDHVMGELHRAAAGRLEEPDGITTPSPPPSARRSIQPSEPRGHSRGLEASYDGSSAYAEASRDGLNRYRMKGPTSVTALRVGDDSSAAEPAAIIACSQASRHCVRTYSLALASAASGLSVAPDSTVSQPEY